MLIRHGGGEKKVYVCVCDNLDFAFMTWCVVVAVDRGHVGGEGGMLLLLLLLLLLHMLSLWGCIFVVSKVIFFV